MPPIHILCNDPQQKRRVGVGGAAVIEGGKGERALGELVKLASLVDG